MIDLTGKLLKTVLQRGVPNLPSANISFVAPDKAWKDSVTGTEARLSVYLVDLRENVKLRSNTRIEPSPGRESRMPYRLDCHYLVNAHTASNAPNAPLSHLVLYQVTAALVASQPLIPAKFYAQGANDLIAWAEFADVELPMTVNPHEGFPKLAEFWGTFDTPHPWLPPIYVIVTVPVRYSDRAIAGTVRQTISTYRVGGSDEVLTDSAIAGRVLDPNGAPVGRALIILEDNSGEVARTESEDDGSFALRIAPGAYRVYAAVFGRGVTAAVVVTAGTADVLLKFT